MNALPKVVLKELRRLEPVKTAAFFAGLTLLPELLSNNYRLELLIHSALVEGRNKSKQISKPTAKKIFSAINGTFSARQEDPAEDVMVSLVKYNKSCFLLLEGLNESNGFHTQRFLTIVERLDIEVYGSVKKSIEAILLISNEVIKKAGLSRYQEGGSFPVQELEYELISDIKRINSFVKFDEKELQRIGVDISDIIPFIYLRDDNNDLVDVELGSSMLEGKPIILLNGIIYVVLPSSIGIAIRRFIIKAFKNIHALDTLEQYFQLSYIKLFYDDLRLFGQISSLQFLPVKDSTGKICGAQNVIGIGEGRFLHLVLQFDDFEEYEVGFVNGCSPNIEAISEAIQDEIKNKRKNLKESPLFREGRSLIILCGSGRVFGSIFRDELSDWQCDVISASDLSVWSQYKNVSLNNFWSFLSLKKLSADSGLYIPNPNGLLNLYGWALENRNNIIPHDKLAQNISIESTKLLIDHNYLLKVRKDVYQSHDQHCVTDLEGNFHQLQRFVPYPAFAEDSCSPIYISYESLSETILKGKVYGNKIDVWVEVKHIESSDKSIEFRIFESMCKWIYALDGVLTKLNIQALDRPVVWRLAVLRYDHEVQAVPDYNSLLSLIENKANITSNTLVINTNLDGLFLAGLNQEKNSVERALIQVFLDTLLSRTKVELSSSTEEILNLIFGNGDARYVHSFVAREFLDFVQHDLQKPIRIDDFIDSASRVRLGQKNLKDGHKTTIYGVDACTEYLNGLVEKLIYESINFIKQFDKECLIYSFLDNSNSISADTRTWKRTIRANYALHKNRENITEVVAEHISRNNSAELASRLIIEMALCEADGNIKVDIIDIQTLLTQFNWLFHLGNLSDSIKYKAMSAELRISPSGDVLYDQNFTESIVDRLGATFHELDLSHQESKYSKYFSKKEIISDSSGFIDSEFEVAFDDEYGFSINEGRKILDAIEDIGVESGNSIYDITQNDFSSICKRANVSAKCVSVFFDSLSVIERKNWDTPPKNYHINDILPWKFRRRLSLISKPIVRLSNKYIMSPRLIRESFVYLVGNCYEGDFDKNFFNSALMKSWIGAITNKKGHEFNKKVAKEFESQGWKAVSDQELSALLNTKIDKKYGDIDVVAWNPSSGKVLLIECKHLEFAKSPSEISKQLSVFRGEEIGGKPDRLLKHLRRMECINNNISLLEKNLKLDTAINVQGVLLFSNTVPMFFVESKQLKKLRLMTFNQIPEIVESFDNE